MVFTTSFGKSFNKLIIAFVTVSSFLVGIHFTKYNLDFLSAKDTKQYLLLHVRLNLPETSVSASQCPNVFLLYTSLGLFLIVFPILNFPLVSAGLLNLPFLLKCLILVLGIYPK